MPTLAGAETYAVRLRWQPSTDPGVAGYHAYIRLSEGSYTSPQDLGLAAPEADGTLSFVIGDLDTASGYAFALTAYLADGTESGLSNELEVPARSASASCTSDADCIDGASAEPCENPYCLAGSCVAPGVSSAGSSDHALTVDRFVFRTRGRPRRLHAHGFFVPTNSLDPTTTGVSVNVEASGGMLYSASVPPGAFVARRRGDIVRYVARHGLHRAAPGLTRLVVEAQDGRMDVTLGLGGPRLAGLAGQPSLTWVVRVGEECMRDPDLHCAAPGPVTSCQ